jgi:hypothetical protein
LNGKYSTIIRTPNTSFLSKCLLATSSDLNGWLLQGGRTINRRGDPHWSVVYNRSLRCESMVECEYIPNDRSCTRRNIHRRSIGTVLGTANSVVLCVILPFLLIGVKRPIRSFSRGHGTGTVSSSCAAEECCRISSVHSPQ